MTRGIVIAILARIKYFDDLPPPGHTDLRHLRACYLLVAMPVRPEGVCISVSELKCDTI